VKKKRLSRQDIQKRGGQQILDEYTEKSINILYKHQDALSMDKYDLGLDKMFSFKLHLKSKDLVYKKLSKIIVTPPIY
jgi:hypothetical protein